MWGIENFAVCPSTNSFERGTYIIGIYSYRSSIFATGVGTNFTITVAEKKLPNYTGTNSTKPKCNYPNTTSNATHGCLQDDQIVFLDFTSNQTVQNNGVLYFIYMVQPNPSGGPTTIYRDTNSQLFTSWTNPRPIPIDHPRRRYSPIDDPELYEQSTQGMSMHDIFSVKVDKATPLYIAVLQEYTLPNGPYVFYTSRYQDWSILKPLSAMSHFEWSLHAHATSRVSCRNNSGTESLSLLLW